MRPTAGIPLALLAGGIGLLAYAVARGDASVALFLVIPVVYGASFEFFLGVVLLFLGLVTLPWALGYTVERAEPPDASPRKGTPPSEVGGLILLGPLPIFFGSWRDVPRRTRWAVAGVGAMGLVALVLLVVLGLGLR
jgi:uncharacterized membrane protein